MRSVIAHTHPLVRVAISYILRSRFGNGLETVTVETIEGLRLAIDLSHLRGELGLVLVDLGLDGIAANSLSDIVSRAAPAPVAATAPPERPDLGELAAAANLAIALVDSRSPERFVGEIERICGFAPVAEAAVKSWRPTETAEAIACGTDGAGLPSDAEDRDRLVRLTPRQRDILDGLRQGLSNKQIAQNLGISHATVKIHVHDILDRLGVANRTQAALLGCGDLRSAQEA